MNRIQTGTRPLAILFLVVAALLGAVRSASFASDQLSWDANTEPDLAGYKLYYGYAARTSNNPPGGYPNVIDVGNITSFTLASLNDNVDHYFSLTAYDTSSNESSFSNEAAKLATGGGGSDGGANGNWNPLQPVVPYPVPFKGGQNQLITLSNVPPSAQLSIYSLEGTLVLQRDVSGPNYSFAPEGLQSGVYVYQIIGSGQKISGKIVIIR